MGDLYPITYNTNLHNSSLGWDFHGLGVINADMSHFMDTTTPFFSPSNYSFDKSTGIPSTGYLQDALIEFNDRKKRRCMLFDHQFDRTSSSIDQKGSWELNQAENYPENNSYLSQMAGSSEILGVKTVVEEEMSVSEVFDYTSSSPKDSSNSTNYIPNKDHHPERDCDAEQGKKTMTSVVYPFSVVKPGGLKGDLTLKDINRRILMTPTRPVKHPVGDYACRSMVVSPHGPGLSGKAVVALTRLYMPGRKGTITIIRTKG